MDEESLVDLECNIAALDAEADELAEAISHTNSSRQMARVAYLRGKAAMMTQMKIDSEVIRILSI